MISGDRVVRDGQTLTVYAHRRLALLTALMGAAFIAAGATGFEGHILDGMEPVYIVLGVGVLPFAP